MSKPILYTTGCPACITLKQMLDKANIEYEEKTNIQEMKALGFTKVPVLSIDENLLLFPDAVAWIQQKGAES